MGKREWIHQLQHPTRGCKYNSRIVREVAALYNYPLIDINAVTSTHPEWFLKDCVHPDKKGAEEIAFRVKDAIMSL